MFKISHINNDGEIFKKCTKSCGKCFQRGHLAPNCRNPLRHKNYKNDLQPYANNKLQKQSHVIIYNKSL